MITNDSVKEEVIKRVKEHFEEIDSIDNVETLMLFVEKVISLRDKAKIPKKNEIDVFIITAYCNIDYLFNMSEFFIFKKFANIKSVYSYNDAEWNEYKYCFNINPEESDNILCKLPEKLISEQLIKSVSAGFFNIKIMIENDIYNNDNVKITNGISILKKSLEKIDLKLSNNEFLKNAPKEVIAKEKFKKLEIEVKINDLNSLLNSNVRP